MALLFMDGFDAGDFAQKWSDIGNLVYVSSTTRFGQGSSLRSLGSPYYVTKAIPASSQVIVGFAYMAQKLDTDRILTLRADTVEHILCGINTQGGISLWRGSTSALLTSSATGLITQNSWNYIEVKASIDDANGSVEIKLNGATVINFTGDTRNAGSSTDITAVRLSANDLEGFFDDVYICDSTGPAPYNNFLGDVRVRTLVPNGAGSSTQFTPSAGANYETVDEIPYSSSDYVQSNTPGHIDLYTTTDIPTSDYVFAVNNNVIAKKSDAGTGRLRSVLKSGGTTVNGTTVTLGTSDTVVNDMRTVDPDTSTAWTVSGVNAIESGMEVI